MLRICTIRAGAAFAPAYVDILFDSVRRNLAEGTVGEFVCFTDQPEKLAQGISSRPLPVKLPGGAIPSGLFPDGDRVLWLNLTDLIVGRLDEIAACEGDPRKTFPHLFTTYAPHSGPPDVACVVSFNGPYPHEITTGWVPEFWKIDGLTRAELDSVCNTAEDQRLSNARSAIARDLLWFDLAPAHNGHVCLVGGGPSLVDTLDELKWRASIGQQIWALNGTARFLYRNGICPNVLVVADARPENVDFLGELNRGISVYLASQCHPELFEAAQDFDLETTLWHTNSAGMEELLKDEQARPVHLIGGGSTVGLNAMVLAFAAGYREMHLYGFDSSYRDDAHHAYPQSLNDKERIVDALFRDQKFKVAPWMAHQVNEFKELVPGLMSDGCIITVAGDGLLPAVARAMMDAPENDAACYDLAQAPASWDFATWLIVAEMAKRRRGVSDPLRVAFLPGPKNGFRDDGLPVSSVDRQQFLDHVVRPLLSLTGAVEDPSAFNGYRHHYLHKEIVDHALAGEAVPRFTAPREALDGIRFWLMRHGMTPGGYITITLREAEHWPDRNSNLAAWLSFAEGCGHPVVFVRDTAKADEPLPVLTCPAASKDVQARAALYQQAKCNLFTSNGTFSLGLFGSAPYLMFKPLCPGTTATTPEWWANQIGIAPGTQAPWATDSQKIVWADDTPENIGAAFTEFLAIPQTEKMTNGHH